MPTYIPNNGDYYRSRIVLLTPAEPHLAETAKYQVARGECSNHHDVHRNDTREQ